MIARISKSLGKKDQGFTLIELLVVMIIIGILAAIAIPVFLNQRQSANDSAVKSDLRSAATEVETAYVQDQAYPADDEAFEDLPVELSPNSSITYTVTDGGDAYCMVGTKDGASQDWVYDSNAGGLQDSSVETCS